MSTQLRYQVDRNHPEWTKGEWEAQFNTDDKMAVDREVSILTSMGYYVRVNSYTVTITNGPYEFVGFYEPERFTAL